ncbi:MAG: hypothetical protein IPP12_05670 [Nitrospira sp.]|nr:hypothetical protein [Nitrospira sp.]MBK9946661.1 hypothetical protein [Nitrospira sp.]
MNAQLRIVLVLLVLMSGCATPVTPEQIASADYGTVPESSLYRKAIQDLVQQSLLEPFPARIRIIKEPQKGYAYLSGRRKPPEFGYIVHVGITAKNLMGEYRSEKPHRFFIKNETLYLLNESDKAEVVE